MKHAATLNETIIAQPDNTSYHEHQVVLLLSGTAPAGSEIALERKAAGSSEFIPVRIDGVPVVFRPDDIENDTVMISMKVEGFKFIPNAVYTNDTNSAFGYKIFSWRS